MVRAGCKSHDPGRTEGHCLVPPTDLLGRIEETAPQDDELAGRIRQYIAANLHRGLTLKDLAEFLGYFEKYRSDLF